MSTNAPQFIADLDGGILEEKLTRVLSMVAAAVVDTGKAGKVSLSLDIKQIGNAHQVEISHKLNYASPTLRGKQSEEETTATPCT